MAEGHLLGLDNITKYYGNILALRDVSTYVNAGEVTCVLGDNGAGKSTFIKILSGRSPADRGHDPHERRGGSLRLARGAARQGHRHRVPRSGDGAADVGVAQLLPRLEPTKSIGPFKWIDKAAAKRIAKSEMAKMGIDIRDTEQPVGTLSGGERQSVAIARAGYFGAKVLILDEPTSALGVKQSGVVLKRIVEARNRAGGDLHHPQPAPRLPGRQPLPDPQPRPSRWARSPRTRSRSTS